MEKTIGWRKIRAKYKSKCFQCSKSLSVGDKVYYNKEDLSEETRLKRRPESFICCTDCYDKYYRGRQDKDVGLKIDELIVEEGEAAALKGLVEKAYREPSAVYDPEKQNCKKDMGSLEYIKSKAQFV